MHRPVSDGTEAAFLAWVRATEQYVPGADAAFARLCFAAGAASLTADLAAAREALGEATKARDVWCAEASASRDHLDRLRTIVDEAFGMRPVESIDETLTALEQGLFDLSRRYNAVLAERDALKVQLGVCQAERLEWKRGAKRLAAKASVDAERAERDFKMQVAGHAETARMLSVATAQVREARREALQEVYDKWSNVSYLDRAAVGPSTFSLWLAARIAASAGTATQTGEEKS